MKGLHVRRVAGHVVTWRVCTMSFMLLLWSPNAFAEAPKPSPASDELQRLGKRMFQEAVLPSGAAMQVSMPGDHRIPGTTFTCASCHLRSGLGAVEEGVCYPAINGIRLFAPFQAERKRGIEANPTRYPSQHSRPAYTDKSLAEAISKGLDPSGRKLSEAMPRYLLDDDAMATLISYLKSLSSAYSPGVSDIGLKFATVITDDVSQDERDATLISLLGLIGGRDRKAWLIKQVTAVIKNPMFEGEMMTAKSKPISLSPWVLKGPRETWRAQLEEYNRNEPVFALLGGITKGEWEPIHRFSEDHRIPCIFPNTDFPVISDTDWYTVYLSKGYYQEGEAAARYLNKMEDALKGGGILQIVRDSPEGRALSRGFEETWRDLGQKAPDLVVLKPGDRMTQNALQQLLSQAKPGAIVLWDGPEALHELERLEGAENRPAMVYVSSSYVGKGLWSIKEEIRDFTFITYPFRLPQSSRSEVAGPFASSPTGPDVARDANQAYSINQILTMALMEMKKNYYRDNFLDVIGMSDEIEVPLYERLNFGAGRYAVKGCYIIQLAKGEGPTLIRKSDWVID